MIQLLEDRRRVGGIALGGLWIGNAVDERCADRVVFNIGGVLNVAQDLVATQSWWSGIEYMQVGLVDGPGNEPAVYASAVLALHALLRRHNTLVCCHGGGRSLAVAVMYMNVSVDRSWGRWMELLSERVDTDLPEVNEVHKEAFTILDWYSLKRVIGR